MIIKLWKTETVNSMGTWLFQVRTNGLEESRGVHSASGHHRYPALLLALPCTHCINCIMYCVLDFPLGFIMTDISSFQECPLFALPIRSTTVKMTPCTPKWDKSTSADIVHWGKLEHYVFIFCLGQTHQQQQQEAASINGTGLRSNTVLYLNLAVQSQGTDAD